MSDYWNNILQEVLHKGQHSYTFAFTPLNPDRRRTFKVSESKPNNSVIRAHYSIGPQYPDVYFTRREAECMVQLLKGKTIQKTATTLGISHRTVEFYVKKMREKLNCETKSELLEKVTDSDFLKNVDFVKYSG